MINPSKPFGVAAWLGFGSSHQVCPPMVPAPLRSHSCWMVVVLSLGIFRVTSPTAVATEDSSGPAMAASHRAVFQRYCFDCHGGDKQEGGVRLDDLPFAIEQLEQAERWQKVLNVLNSGEMPPAESRQPTAEEKTSFLEELSHVMVKVRKRMSDQGGIITMRRLNRREYANTVRELLGVSVDVKSLPSDTGSAGFDTVGKSLFFSADQLEQYLSLARRAIDEVIEPGARPERQSQLRECEQAGKEAVAKSIRQWSDEERRARLAIQTGNPSKYGYPDVARAEFQKGNAVLRLPLNRYLQQHPLFEHGAMLTLLTGYTQDITTFPPEAPPGRYILRVRVAALPGVEAHRHFLELAQRVGGDTDNKGLMVLRTYRVQGTPDQPQTLEIPVEITRSGERTFVLRERERSEKAIVTFRRDFAENRLGTMPALWLDAVAWEGPIVEQWPPPAYQRLFFHGPEAEQTSEYARAILERFAEGAFRGKPVEPVYVDKLMEFFELRRTEGVNFERALQEPLAIILASPSFLYLNEIDDDESTRQPLNDLELASRLSYFLWSSPPDDELLALARSGRLHRPEVLAEQTERLLKDPRSQELVAGFLSQWLQLDRLDLFQFNPVLYPKFDASMKLAARQEVFQTFRWIMEEGLPLREWLKADYVVIDDLLADYYGIEGVIGSEFRRVALPSDSPRGGLLGMAAILAIGSDGERSSPVERGAFVLRKVLHDPPPPAPANVPQLSRLTGEGLSARELLAAHMEEAQCAQCHRHIDPIGFGLENFNAAGLWREQEVLAAAKPGKATRKKASGKDKPAVNEESARAIDSHGRLPDGAAFRDYFELRELLAQRTDRLARGLLEGLIEYGLGRPFGVVDEALAEEIMQSAAASGYNPRVMIRQLVQSSSFQRK